MDQNGRQPLGYQAQRSYHRYVKSLSLLKPHLPKLTETLLQATSNTARPHDTSLFGSLIVQESASDRLSPVNNYDGRGPRRILEREILSTRTRSNDRWIIIAEDVQAEGILYLGQTFYVNPIAFEQYLNRVVTFQSQSSQYIVFDYPETYQSNGAFSGDPKDEPISSPRNGQAGHLVHSHIILVDSLPTVKNRATYHLSREFGTFEDFLETGEIVTLPGSSGDSCYHIIQSNILRNSANASAPSVPNLRRQVAETIIFFLSMKWEVMLHRVQENISEARAPISGDLELIEEVLQRKHDFEKLHRTITVVINSIKSIILDIDEEPPALIQMREYEKLLEGWVEQLGKVSESMLGMLAISESRRASGQAVQSQNLQILAFVFIPISTVASVFGMNTLEVNGSSPRMWQFAVAAIGSTILAALIAWLYRYHDSISVIKFLNSIKRPSSSGHQSNSAPVPSPMNDQAEEIAPSIPLQFVLHPQPVSQEHISDFSLESGPADSFGPPNLGAENLALNEFLFEHSKRNQSACLMM
ncbi:hypothetical protein N7456_012134 [Penicillium angulare]|uniref:Mg2+ transporter protein, CorA-like/Zinc transport protein ZntB n=1 Tax=Penicillium angulare TaxID=116970 RepID=A0A9W9EV05_9EURO|nr:hypothetical protein N7456_012134 [Penicillium angulare]